MIDRDANAIGDSRKRGGDAARMCEVSDRCANAIGESRKRGGDVAGMVK